MTPQSSGWTQWHLNHFLLMVHDDQPQLGSCYCRTIRSSTDRENAVRRRPWMFCFFSWNLPVGWRRRSSAADPSYASLEFGMLNTRPVQLPQQLSICLPPLHPPPPPALLEPRKRGREGQPLISPARPYAQRRRLREYTAHCEGRLTDKRGSRLVKGLSADKRRRPMRDYLAFM